MILLIILLLISLGFAWQSSLQLELANSSLRKRKWKKRHDYSLLFGLAMLMLIYSSF